MTKRIFISYRRSDTQMTAGRLRDALVHHFGAHSVFRDKEGIRPGYDWNEEIQRVLSGDIVVLALIGPQWISSRDTRGQRRLDDPHDSHRVEIEAALGKNVPVIPVLVEGAEIPPADELPPSLAPLIRRHAVRLRDDDWDADVSRLARSIGGTKGNWLTTIVADRKTVLVAVVVGAVIVAGALVLPRLAGPVPQQSSPTPESSNGLPDSGRPTAKLMLKVYGTNPGNPRRAFYDHVTYGKSPGSSATVHGYDFMWDDGYVFENEQPGTKPLILFYNGSGENFTTAATTGEHSRQSALADGYLESGVEGWIYTSPRPGTLIPLKLFYSSERRDYFTTASRFGEQTAVAAGYQLIRTEGYIFPP